MSAKITEAVIRKDGKKLRVVTPDDMNEVTYEKEYKGYLYCPHPECKAQVYFVDGYIQTKHFRSFPAPKGTHMAKCPYHVSHTDSSKPKRGYDSDYKYRISDEHISAVLRHAYQIIVEGKQKELKGSNNDNVKKPTQPTYIDPNLTPRGQ